MSNQDHKAEVSAGTPVPVTREQFEQERLTRRGLLRRLGLTAGTSLFSLMAIDDVVRATVAKMRETQSLRGVAETVAVEFKNVGVAFAEGDPCHDVVPCSSNFGPDSGPFCRNCANQIPINCDDCEAVADLAYCNCMQTIINQYPYCFDSSGQPIGGCPQITAPIAYCYGQRAGAC